MKKHYTYINNFIKFLALANDDPTLASMTMYMKCPKNKREFKLMTARILICEDISNVIKVIQDSPETDGRKPNWKMTYIATLLFCAYSGQRPITVSRLTVGQFRKALTTNPHVLIVDANQDKLRMAHHVPLHPVLIPYLIALVQDRPDADKMFDIMQLQDWLRIHPQSIKNTEGHLLLKDLRKFFEQKSDEVGFVDANKNYIMSHGVSSINWTSYKAFLPENVYARYMNYWKDVKLI